MPETPIREQHDIEQLQQISPVSTRTYESHIPSLPTGHRETDTSSSSTCGDTYTSGTQHSHQPEHQEPRLPSNDHRETDGAVPLHGHTRRTRSGRRRDDLPSHGRQRLLSQLRSEEASRRGAYLTRTIPTCTSVSVPSNLETTSLSEVESAVSSSAGAVSGLGVSHEERRSAFTPVFPLRPFPPPTSGPNGLGFVLASSYLPTPFSHSGGGTSPSSVSHSSSYTSPFTTSSSLAPPTSYGSREYWSSMASQVDQGTSFIASHSAGRRASDARSNPTSISPLPTTHGGLSSFPPPLNPIRAHQSHRIDATLYSRRRPPYYSHSHVTTVTSSSRNDSPTQHIIPHSTAFPSIQVPQSPPPPSMPSLMSEVSPTVMPVSPTMMPYPRYVSLTSHPMGTSVRHSGLLTSTTSTDVDSSTSPVTSGLTTSAITGGAANVQSARGLPYGEVAASELSSRSRDEQLRTNITSTSSTGHLGLDYRSSGVARVGRAEVDVIVVVDSSDEVRVRVGWGGVEVRVVLCGW